MIFGLRQKLSLGFGGLLIIIILIGVQSIVQLSQLGQSIDVILRENYRSVIACQEMKESAERIDSGLLFTLLGYGREGRELVAANQVLFRKALKTELNNVTLPGEGEKARHLAELYTSYESMIKTLEDARLPFSERRDVYFTRLLPLFVQIKNAADTILQMNQGNMGVANEAARKRAAKAREQMYILLLAGVVVAVVFIFFAGKWILRPVNRLIHSAEQIKDGNLQLVIQSDYHDEIGKLSETFNDMALRLREFRRSDQAKLIRTQRATQRAFDSMPGAIAIIDLEGRVEIATELARESFGLKQNILMQNLPYPWMVDIYGDALRNGRPAQPKNGDKIVQQFVKGEERYFSPEAVPILDHESQPAGVVIVLHDVTQMRAQDEMKKSIISTVSHQLKTPLTSIRMAIYLLLDEKVGALAPKQEELLIAAREDAERLYEIINGLLEISRIESGKAQMNFEAIYGNTMVLDSVELFRITAQDRGITLRLELPDYLPKVWADRSQISHVFANLLSNALRYTDPGGTISISADSDDKKVTFKVSDTGGGVPPQYVDHIFEKFFRVPEQDIGTGAGLGLAIVREIIEAHGGEVGVESREGQGSIFIFSLRRADLILHEGSTL